MFLTAAVLAGSARMPSLSTMWPKNFTCSLLNSHLLALSVTPAASKWLSDVGHVLLVRLQIQGRHPCDTTPGRPSRILDILLWDSSGALEIPKGSSLNQ